jgi:hypothetical protein
MTQKIYNIVIALGLVVALGIQIVPVGALFGASPTGSYDSLVKWFGNIVYFGTTQQMSVSTTGNVITSGTVNSGLIAVSSTTPSSLGDVVVDSSATTTIFAASSGTLKGACLQLENSSGVLTRAYVGAAGNAFIVEAGSCK